MIWIAGIVVLALALAALGNAPTFAPPPPRRKLRRAWPKRQPFAPPRRPFDHERDRWLW